jgi:putative oxidoreductase
MEKLNPYIGLAGRIMIVLIFPLSGYGKLAGFSGTQAYMESMGVPGMLLPLVLLLEFGGALAVILGWHTRIVAFLFAGFCLLTALIFHNQLGDQIQFLSFMRNVSMAGGFLFLVKYGAGELSLDNRVQRKAESSR